jgi:integrase
MLPTVRTCSGADDLPAEDDEAIRAQLAADLGTTVRRGTEVDPETGQPSRVATRVPRVKVLRDVLADPSFGVVLGWLTSARRSSLATKRGYADELIGIADWIHERSGQAPVDLLWAITGATITAWTIRARAHGYSVRTQRRTLSALSSLFTYAAAHDVNVLNPVSMAEHAPPDGAGQNGRPPGATRVLSMPEIAALSAACHTPEEVLIFDLCCLQGLRESEVTTLRIEHIDFHRSPPLAQVQRKRNKWATRELAGDTAAALGEYLDGRVVGPVFVHPDTGEAIARHRLISHTRRLARRAGLPEPARVTPHVLRASAITDLLDKAHPLHEVQAWAGHANSATTEGYWHRSRAPRRDAALSASLAADIAEAAPGGE